MFLYGTVFFPLDLLPIYNHLWMKVYTFCTQSASNPIAWGKCILLGTGIQFLQKYICPYALNINNLYIIRTQTDVYLYVINRKQLCIWINGNYLPVSLAVLIYFFFLLFFLRWRYYIFLANISIPNLTLRWKTS